MATVKRFEDLTVWQSARALVNAIYDATKGRWFGEDKAFCWQIRDAAISAMSNIAEGFERGSNKEFIQALFISKGSAGEVRSDLYPALDQGFITKPQFDALCEQCLGLSRQLMALVAYLRGSSYKGDKFHEAKAVYEVSPPEPNEAWTLDLPDLEP
jgi:four helix bundle protein